MSVSGNSPSRRMLVRLGGAAPLVALAAAFWPLRRAEAAPEESLPRIDDLRPLLAQVRRTRVPLLLFFSTPGCPYCRDVRGGYLAPRLRAGARDVVIREVSTTGSRHLIDRDGGRISEARLAARFGVRMVPVVQLVDSSLQPLGEPLIGIDRSGFYEAYLAAAIGAAGKALRDA